MGRADLLATAADVKMTAMLVRDARAVLRRIDVLIASAAAVDDQTVREIADLRSAAERLLAHSHAARAVRSAAHAKQRVGLAEPRSAAAV
jgi:hypothetical protein